MTFRTTYFTSPNLLFNQRSWMDGWIILKISSELAHMGNAIINTIAALFRNNIFWDTIITTRHQVEISTLGSGYMKNTCSVKLFHPMRSANESTTPKIEIERLSVTAWSTNHLQNKAKIFSQSLPIQSPDVLFYFPGLCTALDMTCLGR